MINFIKYQNENMSQKVRWGIVGLGSIANHFAKDLELVPNGVLSGVASRSIDKAKKFANEYGASHFFGSYLELFESDVVDVIYIATPHTLHAELAILAMEHGKHVLCEKPMGINKLEVEKMVEAAKKHQVFLMEALWSRFNPTIQKVKQLIAQGAIGKVSYLNATFAFYALGRDENGRVLNKALGGGTILDIGIYPIFLSYLIFGKPSQIQASSNFNALGTEVQTAMIFSYSDAQAILYSGFTSASEMKTEIAGTEGSIFIHPRWHETQSYAIKKEDELQHFELPTIGKGYTYEIEEVHRCLAENTLESTLWSHQNSLDLISMLDEVRKQTGVIFPSET